PPPHTRPVVASQPSSSPLSVNTPGPLISTVGRSGCWRCRRSATAISVPAWFPLLNSKRQVGLLTRLVALRAAWTIAAVDPPRTSKLDAAPIGSTYLPPADIARGVCKRRSNPPRLRLSAAASKVCPFPRSAAKEGSLGRPVH